MNIKTQPAKRLIIGSGRLANHLMHWWNLKKIPYSNWSRKADPKSIRLNSIVEPAEFVYLAVSDLAIEPVLKQILEINPNFINKKYVHFSGSLTLQSVLGAHPLMSFGPSLYTEDQYDKITYVLEGKSTFEQFLDLFPQHPNTTVSIEPEQKKIYHALIVLLGNLPTLMLKEFLKPLSSMGLQASDLKPYLQVALENSVSSPNSAATGPWVRGDVNTIDSHLSALRNTPYLDFYLSALKTFGHKNREPKQKDFLNV